MKIHSKKKAYQREMKKAAQKGLVNDHEGKMVPASQIKKCHERMVEHYFAGHKIEVK